MAEFDRYANDYHSMLDNSLAPIGGFSDYYSRQKVAHLENFIQKAAIRSVLDFGCGLGGTTAILKDVFFDARIVGVDVSEVSVEQARQQNSNIEFGCIADKEFMSCVGTFDLIYVANVFHHVPPIERNHVMNLLKILLAPNGKVFFFEHNPYNPITKWVVSRCEFDRDAILLPPAEARRLFEVSGFQVSRTTYLLFFPHMLRILSKLERSFEWLPLGAQYCLMASL